MKTIKFMGHRFKTEESEYIVFLPKFNGRSVEYVYRIALKWLNAERPMGNRVLLIGKDRFILDAAGVYKWFGKVIKPDYTKDGWRLIPESTFYEAVKNYVRS